jgi:hypothetical protein
MAQVKFICLVSHFAVPNWTAGINAIDFFERFALSERGNQRLRRRDHGRYVDGPPFAPPEVSVMSDRVRARLENVGVGNEIVGGDKTRRKDERLDGIEFATLPRCATSGRRLGAP